VVFRLNVLLFFFISFLILFGVGFVFPFGASFFWDETPSFFQVPKPMWSFCGASASYGPLRCDKSSHRFLVTIIVLVVLSLILTRKMKLILASAKPWQAIVNCSILKV